ncbi:MAG TPA: hypothetical protein VHT94_04030 [Streptosporangiaceae bacterium]|jgi:hypothetical protein|nr:hypothetical protein [Streptosporangiaceae bacterium]
MRSRIMSAFVAVAAAGVTTATLGLAAAGAANASVATKAQPKTIGPAIGSTTSAGYQASGRNFRYISSTLTVPDTSFLTGLYPQEYIQLSNGSLTQFSGGGNQYVRAGIESCTVAKSFGYTCSTGTWVAYVEAFNNSLNGPYFSHYAQLAGVNQGDGVNFSIYYYQGGNELSFVITPPSTSGTPQYYKTRAYGPIFDHAAALDDFTDSTGTPIALPPFIHSFRINQFLQGALTTYSGAKGSFTGPWTTSPVIATSNGLLPPSGATRVSPSPLWTDGLSANGAFRANDAFGVWAR